MWQFKHQRQHAVRHRRSSRKCSSERGLVWKDSPRVERDEQRVAPRERRVRVAVAEVLRRDVRARRRVRGAARGHDVVGRLAADRAVAVAVARDRPVAVARGRRPRGEAAVAAVVRRVALVPVVEALALVRPEQREERHVGAERLPRRAKRRTRAAAPHTTRACHAGGRSASLMGQAKEAQAKEAPAAAPMSRCTRRRSAPDRHM